MTKDRLFLLQGTFMKGLEGPFYCPECIAIEGLIAYFPRLIDEIDVVRVGFEHPRPAIVELLGEENQNSPVIVLADRTAADTYDIPVKEYEGNAFIDVEKDILAYLSLNYKVSRSAS